MRARKVYRYLRLTEELLGSIRRWWDEFTPEFEAERAAAEEEQRKKEEQRNTEDGTE